MEHELWSCLKRAIRDVSRSRFDSAYHTHSTISILSVYLWAVLHDRPTSWACHPKHWPSQIRPKTLPSQPTMSRRLRSEMFLQCLRRLGKRLNGRLGLSWIKFIDGKSLSVAAHSKDPDATWGYGASQSAKGYKLHVIDGSKPMPETFEVRTMSDSENRVAREMIPALKSSGYLIGDANYDDSELCRLAQEQGMRFIAPRRRRYTGLGKKTTSHPERLRNIALLEAGPMVGNHFGTDLVKWRTQIERTFGNLCSFGAGLKTLPPWVRRLHRVKLYVHAKLLINAARIRVIRE